MTTRQHVMKKIYSIIGQPGQRKQVVDRALAIFDTIATGRILHKSLPTIDTRQKDEVWKKQLAKNHRNTDGSTSSDAKKDQKQEDNTEKPPVDIGHNKDHKPVSTNKWKLKLPSGRTYLYAMSDNGSVKRKEVDDYIPEYKGLPTFHHDHISEMHRHIEDDRADNSKKPEVKKSMEPITKAQIADADAELDRLQKAEPPLRWGQTPRFLGEKLGADRPAATSATPATGRPSTQSMAQKLRASRTNLSQMTGHEMAAVKQGVDLSRLPAGTDLTRMSKDQMSNLARTQTLEATEPAFRAAGKCYRR